MNGPQNERSLLPPRGRRTSGGSARRHSPDGFALASLGAHPPSCAPFAPGPLRPFLALMGALTPARSVAAVLGLFPAATRSAPREQVSLIHALGLPAIPSPTTGASPDRLRTSWRIGPDRLGLPLAGFRSLSAGSPYRVGRIEFVILRTGRSPSCCSPPRLAAAQLQAVTDRRWIPLERTFTSPTKCAFRRTDSSLRSE